MGLAFFCKPTFDNDNKNEFLVAFYYENQVLGSGFDPNKLDKIYYGNHDEGDNSLLMKAELNFETLIFKCDYNEKAMLFKNEYFHSACEFDINCFLISVSNGSLLIVKNWEVTVSLDDSEPGNNEKYWLKPLPFFDSEKFPLLITSGRLSFNLVNIKTGKMDILIDGSAFNTRC